ncbi:MAG: hypothetical protein WA434_04880, partial [Candidatus Acidiferrales bacterium]
IIGGKEAEAGTVSVRHRFKGDLGPRPLEQFMADLQQEIATKAIDQPPPAESSSEKAAAGTKAK